MKQLLFTVIEREGDTLGHTYKVYTNGEIEGFKPGSIIMNRYPLLESIAVNEYCDSHAQATDLAATQAALQPEPAVNE